MYLRLLALFTFSQVGGEEVEKAEYSSSIPSSQLSSASAQSKEGRNTMVLPLVAQHNNF
jgi:hypothetical protein